MMGRAARAWARGIRSWRPPHSLRTEFLLAWGGIAVAAVLLWPKVSQLPSLVQAGLAVALVVGAGFLNYLFVKAGEI